MSKSAENQQKISEQKGLKMNKDITSNEIDNIMEISIGFENTPERIGVDFPMDFMHKHLSEKQIQEFIDDLIPIINQYFHKKILSYRNRF